MPDSNSKAFARRLREAVESRRAVEPDEVADDVRFDPDNARAWERYAVVETVLAAARTGEEGADLTARVLARLRVDRGAGAQRRSPAAFGPRVEPVARPVASRPARDRGGAAAAVLALGTLLASLFALLAPSADPRPAPTEVTAIEADAVVAPEAETKPPRLDELVGDTRAAYRSLSETTRETFDDLAFLVGPRSVPAGGEAGAPAEADGGADWLDGVQRRLDPVRSGFGESLDFLLEAAPRIDPATS